MNSLSAKQLANVFTLSCAVSEEFGQWCEKDLPPTKCILAVASSLESDDDVGDDEWPPPRERNPRPYACIGAGRR